MRQPCRKQEQCAIPDAHDHLISALRRELDDRRPQDCGLTAWIVEVDRVGAGGNSQVVNAAQKIVRMGMQLMGSTRSKNSRPAPRDLDGRLTDSQESENSSHQVPHTRDEFTEFSELVKVLR